MYVFRLAFATLTLAAIATEFSVGMQTNPAFSFVNFFSFFTPIPWVNVVLHEVMPLVAFVIVATATAGAGNRHRARATT